MVDERNSAGLVGPKEEGKPQPPLSKEETVFQFERVQRGEVDSARLLLVFGMVPSAGHVDNQTLNLLMEDEEGSHSHVNLPAVFDPGLRYPDGSTPLHMAATFGRLGTVKTLLEVKADVRATSRSGVQPLHAAAIMGHADVVQRLVDGKADVDARHAFAGSTAMHFAAEMGHPAVVRRLCQLRADVSAEKRHGGTAIHISADTNNSAVTRALLDEPCGADPEAVLLGDTVPLYLAAGRGFSQVIDVLLEAGANPDRTLWPQRPATKGKRKRQKKAAESKQLSTDTVSSANFLPGSDPGAPGWEEGNGATALHNACENGHMEAASALLEGGARQLATMQGVTPLITSLQYRHAAIASALLDHRRSAGVNVASPADGQTALHIAAAYDYPEVVASILREGGSTLTKDGRGKVPLDYGRGELTRWLIRRFHGREPQLDSVVKSHRGPGLAEALAAVDGLRPEARERYVGYARRHAKGSLQDEVGRLTRMLSKGSLPAGKHEAMSQRLAIASVVLTGSDVHVAGSAMMMRTEGAMHAALALLGVRVRSIKYKPDQSCLVNGREVLPRVNGILQTLQQGDGARLDEELRSLIDEADGVHRSARKAAVPTLGSGEAEEDVEL